MNIKKYLAAEWVPALGCTEPAAIAFAALNAAAELAGKPEKIILTVDPKIYKNCYAVGIPHSGHKMGIKWTVAIGAFLKNKKMGLQCFEGTDAKVLKAAGELIKKDAIEVLIDKTKDNLFIEVKLMNEKESSRAVIESSHTNLTIIEKDGKAVFKSEAGKKMSDQLEARKWACSLSLEEIIKQAKSLSKEDRKKLSDNMGLNLKIAKFGLSLLPKNFFSHKRTGIKAKVTGLVGAGVYARMNGESFPVMSAAGSGNKGITISVPLILLKKSWKISQAKIEEALLIAMLVLSKTTYELGTLSAVCGCSNAAGIGLTCALVYLKGGGVKEMSLAINNMVGNVTGMICDGAKIGCAMKTMTAVDAAFRSAELAMNGIGIPPEDGIVGRDGHQSLKNMGQVAIHGMVKTDEEILKIMEKKL